MRAIPMGVVGALVLMGAVASAQDKAMVPTTVVATPGSASASPSIKALIRGVNDESHTVDLMIRSLDVKVAVRGGVAETVMDFDLAAPTNSGPVEGRVHIDLPAGSVVTGYALDVNGGLVDGSLIDQSTARAAFDNQVRGQVDPGLAEIDQAGGFNTRVFPIDSVKGRKMRLRFVTPIATGYALPLKLAASTGEWSTTIMQTGVTDLPRVNGGKGALDDVLRIAPAETDDALVSRNSTGETYIQLAGKLPVEQAAPGGTLRIYWDRSRSRRDHDHQAELRRVIEAIAALKPDRIEWVAFSSGEPQRATLASSGEVEAKIHALRYGGATSFSTLADGAPAKNCLLVSDGRPTIDGKAPPVLPCRVFAVATEGSDQARLGVMAQATGGQVVTTGDAAVAWSAPSVTGIHGADGQRLDFVTLPAPAGQWRIIARAPGHEGPVKVTVGGTTYSRTVDVQPIAFEGEAALMASAKLGAMDSTADRPAFIALSRRYSVASPTLSFVVLERPQDYVTNKIAPPANYTRRKEWEELAEEAADDLADAKASRLGELRKAWAEQVAWWEKKFDLAARPSRGSRKSGSVNAPALNEPPPPPPPPPSPVVGGMVARDEAIVVTGTVRPSPNMESAAPVTTVSANDMLDASPSVRAQDVRISVSAWRPERDYLNAYDADPSAFDRVFADWDKRAGGVPAFYLDTADWLDRRGQRARALEVLNSALDLPTANEITIGMVAARLERWGLIDEAIVLRERQATLDPEHPQPRRLLALALAERGTRVDLDRAIRLLTDIAMTPNDDRWDGIDMIALVEANALIPKYRAMGGTVSLDPSLIRNLDSDIRIVLDWSSDAVDIDLWVDQPNGERAVYSNPRTLIGGHLSNDMTEGYGPEEYFLRRGAAGRYSILADVYASDQIDPNGVSRVTAHLFRDWGRPNQRVQSIDLDLQRGQEDEVKIGSLRIGGAPAGSQ